MTLSLRRHLAWLLAWALCATAGAGWLARTRLAELREAFDTDARIVHRLLSQRMAQHDAVMATLALLQPAGGDGSTAAARLPALYPQIVEVQQRLGGDAWPAALAADLDAAEAASRRAGHAVLARGALDQGRYRLVLAGQPASYALSFDLQAAIPWSEWPMDAATSPVRVTLGYAGRSMVVQPGQAAAAQRGPGWGWGWHWTAPKTLSSASQPLDLLAERPVDWRELPLLSMAAWAAFAALLLAGLRTLWQQRIARQRAEELLRLGQVARLNTLGELAAGMAHELNQPLTALLANTQAARRLLADDPPDLDTARGAMARAADQARRAADVVGRLRRLVERPQLATQAQPVPLGAAVHEALHLLEPELRRRAVAVEVPPAADAPAVLAEPVALQQIIHNLLMNALQALEQVPAPQRRLALHWQRQGTQALLIVRDHGPGVAPEARARLFDPFFTTRDGGLGLGLSLCQSLAEALGGSLQLAPPDDQPGAGFHLVQPLATDHPPATTP